ncbi:MAG: LuxR C-terminal-related transcriptional regulator [Chloroflexota bacterium]
MQTKLYKPPVRRELIARSRLNDVLEAGLAGQLVLVSAPAGFGKTTLISGWLWNKQNTQDSGITSAWLSLDETDNDLTRFLLYLIAALQTMNKRWGESALTMLTNIPPAGNHPSANTTIGAIINDLASSTDTIILVLDDYHLITTEAIHQALIFLIDNSPPNFQLIITSRTEPPLRLPRLRVRGLLTEIGVQELRFTRQETADFLNQTMHLSLTEADIDRLDERTEGWIASLQLAAVSLKNEADRHHFVEHFTGNDRQIMDYLLDEVLERQPEYIRDFLLQTSVLQRLNVQLCNTVTAQVGSQQILEDLEQANLFVMPLDNVRHWYRYHPLFAEFLQAYLYRTIPEQTNALHLRASQWYAEQDLLDEAIEHALKANAFAEAAQLMEEIDFISVWGRGQASTIERWLAALPDHIRQNHPALLVLNAWAQQAIGNWDTLGEQLTMIEALLSGLPETSETRDLQGQVLALQAEHSIYRHDFAHAEELLQKAHPLLSEKDLLTRGVVAQEQGYIHRLNGEMEKAKASLSLSEQLNAQVGNTSGQLFAMYDLAELARMRGDLNQTEIIYQHMLDMVNLPENQINLAVYGAHIGLGQLRYRRNDLTQAREHFNKGTNTQNTTAWSGFTRLGLIGLAFIQQASGETKQADQSMEQARLIAEKSGTTWVYHQVRLMQASLWIKQGKLEHAEQWRQSAIATQSESSFIPFHQQQQARLVVAQLFLAQEKTTEAIVLLEDLKNLAIQREWHELAIDIYLYLALATSQDTTAIDCLAQAISLAEPGHYIRPFLDAGNKVKPLLDTYLTRKPYATFGDTLRQAFQNPLGISISNTTQNPSPHKSTKTVPPLSEPLTKREIEIIQLIASGMSNREIADHLFIALGTVGKHTSNIFLKLDAPNRAAAVLRAQELGII